MRPHLEATNGNREATMSWTSDDLFQELKRYERECEAAGLQPKSVFHTWTTADVSCGGASATTDRVRQLDPVAVRHEHRPPGTTSWSTSTHMRLTFERPVFDPTQSTPMSSTRVSSSAGSTETSSLGVDCSRAVLRRVRPMSEALEDGVVADPAPAHAKGPVDLDPFERRAAIRTIEAPRHLKDATGAFDGLHSEAGGPCCRRVSSVSITRRDEDW